MTLRCLLNLWRFGYFFPRLQMQQLFSRQCIMASWIIWLKPFKFPRFEEALNNLREKKKFIHTQQNYGQLDVGKLLHFVSGECVNKRMLPKGITPETLRIIAIWVDSCSDKEFSTDDGASGTTLSRVLCRKYLNCLVKINILSSSTQYRVTGRSACSYCLPPEFLELLKSFC